MSRQITRISSTTERHIDDPGAGPQRRSGTDRRPTIDARTRQRVRPVIRVSDEPSTASATRDGATVVVTAKDPGDNITTVYDGRTGARLAGPYRGPDVTSVSLDGVLFGARGGTVTGYELMSGRELAELPGARGEVNTLQFSDDGRLLLATSNDQTSSLYDVASGTRWATRSPPTHRSATRPTFAKTGARWRSRERAGSTCGTSTPAT